MSLIQSLMPSPTMGAENRSLGLQSAPVTGAAPAAAAGATAGAADPNAAAAAAPGDAAAQATMGAEGVQPTPPKPSKIILSSVIRGAVTGASLMFGINNFGPRIPFIAKAMTGALKFIPFLKLGFPMGTIAALGVGAVVGGIVGLVGGMRKAKAAATEYATAQATAQQQAAAQAQAAGLDPATGQPIGAIDPATGQPMAGAPGLPGADPTTGQPAGAEPPVGAAGKKRRKPKRNPEMGPGDKPSSPAGKSKSKRAGSAGCDCDCGNCGPKADKAAKGEGSKSSKRLSSGGRSYTIRSGDTLGALAARNGTTVDALMRANPQISNRNMIFAGRSLRIPD